MLAPCAAPKFVPVIVTDVATAPDVGFRLVMPGGALPPLAGRNVAMAAAQTSDELNVPFAESWPAEA